jgi:zinc protease
MMRDAGAARAEIALPPLHEARLDNGLRAVVAPRAGLPLCAVRLMVDAGSARDPRGKEGLADLCGTLLRRGTEKRSADEVDEAIERAGGTLEVHVLQDYAVVTASVPSEELATALDVVADVTVRPSFPPREAQGGQRRALAALQRDLDDPSTVADRAITVHAYGEGHPYAHPVHGFSRTVKRLRGADLRAFHRARYAPGSALLVVVGDVDPAAVLAAARTKLGRWKGDGAPPVPAPPPAGAEPMRVVLVDKADATQAQIRIAAPAFARDDPDWFPALVGNTVLGGGFTSILVDEIRVNRGLSYRVGSRLFPGRGAGIWMFVSFTKNETVRELCEVAFAEIEKFRGAGPAAAQLDKARAYLAGQYPQQIESHEALARTLGDAALYGLGWEHITRYPALVAAPGPEAVARASRRYLPARGSGVLVLVGQAAAVREQARAFGRARVVPVKEIA